METERKNETAEFLDRMYKNVKMGAESIVTLMPKVKDEGLLRAIGFTKNTDGRFEVNLEGFFTEPCKHHPMKKPE